jgi:guanine deaminase
MASDGPNRYAVVGAVFHSKGLNFGCDSLEILNPGVVLIDAARGGIILACAALPDLPGFASCASPPPINVSARLAALLKEHSIDRASVRDLRGKIIQPGFVDAHAHAPQYPFTGTGLGLPLLQWLERYTFPTEAKFADSAFARAAYERAVARHLRNGSTTVSWFATIHLEATQILADVCRAKRQRALVGKVCMDRNAPDFYVEPTDQSADDADAFAMYIRRTNAALAAATGAEPGDEGLVQAVVTPRFVPSCTAPLMARLGRLARREGLCVQSHLSESVAECNWVRTLHPKSGKTCYAGVYDAAGLLDPGRSPGDPMPACGAGRGVGGTAAAPGRTDPTAGREAVTRKAAAAAGGAPPPPLAQVSADLSASSAPTQAPTSQRSRPTCYMAHCCQSGPAERALLRARGAGVVHCPNSNFALGSGVLDVRQMLKEGVAVALGTDVAGGYSPCMLDALRQALIASKCALFRAREREAANKSVDKATSGSNGATPSAAYEPLSLAEVFHMATLGGAKVLGLDDVVGNFAVGKRFDALIVNPRAEGGPIDVFDEDTIEDVFNKFCLLGDDRNIEEVIVNGARARP